MRKVRPSISTRCFKLVIKFEVKLVVKLEVKLEVKLVVKLEVKLKVKLVGELVVKLEVIPIFELPISKLSPDVEVEPGTFFCSRKLT